MLINRYANTIPTAELEEILSHALKCSRLELYASDISIDRDKDQLASSLINRRLAGEPLQHITGSAGFMGLDFKVTKDLFIPRPETELLVEEVLLHAREDLKILDLCTGCGNIAVSLSRALPRSEIIATDIVDSSLAIANENAIAHGADRNIRFYKGDLFEALAFNKRHSFDIIVCNPPYIKELELQDLQEEVRREPASALCGGTDGLDFYKRIAWSGPDWLRPGGSIFLEIGFGQARDVRDIFASKKIFTIQKVSKDFAGLDRVIWISLS